MTEAIILPNWTLARQRDEKTDKFNENLLTQLVHDLTDHLGRAVRLPDIDIPRHLAEPEDDIHAIEEHAAMVRTAWGVQPGPIPDVVGLLERHGIVCARYHTGTHTVDAFSVPFADRPIVILGDDKAKRDRERFSGVHELGHLVMHTSEQAGSKAAEDQANQFAAAFLMPADDIRAELPSSAAWNQLVALKRRWGTSIGSLLRRSETRDIMADGTYQQAYRYMGACGWRTNEPGDLVSRVVSCCCSATGPPVVVISPSCLAAPEPTPNQQYPLGSVRFH